MLRAGRPEDDARFPEEDLPTTVHVGAFDGGRLVAVATFFPEPCPEHPAVAAWRLRGMATAENMRGRGAGRALVERGLVLARDAGASLLWCNGRLPALGFYVKLGFEIEGGTFDPHGTGPHHRLVRTVSADA